MEGQINREMLNMSTSSNNQNNGNISSARDLVNPAWLRKILSSYHNTDEENVLLVSHMLDGPYERGDTALSDVYGLMVRYLLGTVDDVLKGNTELRCVLKMLPKDQHICCYVKQQKMDYRELMFYTRIAPELKHFIYTRARDASKITLPLVECIYPPERYDCSSDADTHLLLRDVQPQYHTAKNSLTVSETHAALLAIARFHGVSLAFKNKLNSELDEHFPYLFSVFSSTSIFDKFFDHSVPQLRQFMRANATLQEACDKMDKYIFPNLKELCRRLLLPWNPTSTLVHHDFWTHNLLFWRGPDPNDDCDWLYRNCDWKQPNGVGHNDEDRIEPQKCLVIDWQVIAHGQPTNDIALLVLSSLEPEVRRANSANFLDTYWSEFASVCEQFGLDLQETLGYSRAEFESDYKMSQLLSLLLCFGSADLILGSREMEIRFVEAIRDLEAENYFTADMVEAVKSLPHN